MPALQARTQWWIGAALAALMIATRSAHLPALHVLPPASWAVFFLAGVYLPRWAFGAFFALAFGLDLHAIYIMDVSSFCFTPAYVWLLAAYGALWAAGRWYARRHRDAWTTLVPLALAVGVGAFAGEVLSGGSFYVFSGRFAELSFAEYARQFTTYFPHTLGTTVFWVAVAALVHGAIGALRGQTQLDA